MLNWIDTDGVVYQGDCQVGDRAASDAEVSTWRATVDSLVPTEVSRRQLKLALLELGMLDMIEAAVAASPDRALKIDWAESIYFDRTHAVLVAFASALHKTEADIDALFTLAGSK